MPHDKNGAELRADVTPRVARSDTTQPVRYAGSTDPNIVEERVMRGVEQAGRGEGVEFVAPVERPAGEEEWPVGLIAPSINTQAWRVRLTTPLGTSLWATTTKRERAEEITNALRARLTSRGATEIAP